MFEEIMYFYHDPLFGASILLGIVAILMFADWGRNKYQAKKKAMALQDFAKTYHKDVLSDEIIDLLSMSKNSTSSLLLLAKTYSLAGDRGYAIKIYLGILEQVRDVQERIIVLESLGITYFEAGFLHRAKEVFIEILKSYPRNKQVLDYLLRVYENMGDYEEALDVLESLEELGLSKQQEYYAQMRSYLHFMLLKNSNFLSLDKRQKEIISLARYCGKINRLSLEYLMLYDREAFWEEVLGLDPILHSVEKTLFSTGDINNATSDMDSTHKKDLSHNEQHNTLLPNHNKSILQVLDILWRFSKDEIPFWKVKNHKNIMDIFRAKGYVKDEVECEVFELETLRILHAHSKQKGELTFEYRCQKCKNIFPFDSYRCPICAGIGEMDLVFKIREFDNFAQIEKTNIDSTQHSEFMKNAKQFASNFSH